VSDDPETLGEVARLLRQMRAETDRRFNSLDQRLDKLVSAEVHSRDITNLDRRISDLTGALADERTRRMEAILSEMQSRKDADKEAGDRMSRIDTWQRWLTGGTITLLLSIIGLAARASGA
jgi:hypothetical protein